MTTTLNDQSNAGGTSKTSGVIVNPNIRTTRVDNVKNSASYLPTGVAAPGTIVAIFGQDLTVPASGAPLQADLNGTTVMLNQRALPLFYASKQFSTDLTDFHGGVHFRFLRGESRVIPYAVLGTGVIHASKRQLTTNFDAGPVLSTIPSKTSWEVNFGGGLRFFFTQRIGIRLEMKAFKTTTAPAGVNMSTTVWFIASRSGSALNLCG